MTFQTQALRPYVGTKAECKVVGYARIGALKVHEAFIPIAGSGDF